MSSPPARWFSDPPPIPFEDPNDPDDVLEVLLEDTDAMVSAEARRLRRYRRAAGEVDRLTRNLDLQRRAGGKQAGLVSTSVRDRYMRVGSPSIETEVDTLLPIFDPLHNAREAAKQLVLLEDHLVHPPKHCPDCIRKHLLSTEAFAEEAVTLSKDEDQRIYFGGVAIEVRDIAREYLNGVDRGDLQQRARLLRKKLSKKGFATLGSANRSGSMAPAAAIPVPAVVNTLKANDVLLFRAPGFPRGWYAGRVLAVGETFGETTVKSIPEEGWLAVQVGETGKWLPLNASLVAAAARVGEKDAPPTYVAKDARLSWVKGSSNPAPQLVALEGIDMVVAARSPISQELRDKSLTRYAVNGHPSSVSSLNEEQLMMADIIQGVFHQKFGGTVQGAYLTMLNSRPDLCTLGGVSNQAQVESYGCKERALRQLVRAAVINAWYESGLDPVAIAETSAERSIGLFQANQQGGLGQGHAQENLENPVYNTALITKAVRQRMRRFAGLIALEAQASPTSVSDWVEPFVKYIEIPAQATLVAAARSKTANDLYPPPRQAPTQNQPLYAQGVDAGGAGRAAFFLAYPLSSSVLKSLDQGLSSFSSDSTRLTQAQSAHGLQAAKKWFDSGVQTGEMFPLVRSMSISSWLGDVRGKTKALHQIISRFPGTTQSVEAEQYLQQLRSTHAPEVVAKGTAVEFPLGRVLVIGTLGALFAGALFRSTR